MKKIVILFLLFLPIFVLSQKQNIKNNSEIIWDQGVPVSEDSYILGLIQKLSIDSLFLKGKLTANQIKLCKQIGVAFYDKGMFDSAEWYLNKVPTYVEVIEVKPEKVFGEPTQEVEVDEPLSKSDIAQMQSDLKVLQDLPESYKNVSKSDLKELAKKIDSQIKRLTMERDSLLKINASKELIESKDNTINGLKKDKELIDLSIENGDLSSEKIIIKRYLNWSLIGLIVLGLLVLALLQRKTIKVKDKEIDEQLSDINTKNTYLEHAARIIRHDMHSGINTYIPRGLSSLEKRLTDDDIEKLKISAPIKMIKEGLAHTQKVYKRVYEFTNLVKQNVVLEKTNLDLKELLRSYFDTTSYKDQVEISNLLEFDVNPILFCNSIENLVKNGLQYNNSEKKLVKIYLEGNDIIVEDNGIGLSQEKLETITTKPIDKNDKSEKGLGLIIAKKILEEHGLAITCENNNDGTKIKITIKQKN